jgi:hypothetical protein
MGTLPQGPSPGLAMEILFADVQYALRSLRLNQPYTAIAVVRLALGG